MSTDELRRELDRIADTAPSADVPDDTWTRARRSVVRDRVAVGGAAVAIVAAVAAGLTWLPDRADPPVADSRSAAIPSRLWTVSEGQELGVQSDLAVGAVSAAYFDTDDGGGARVVAVSASDGRYFSLVVPDPDGNDAVQFGWEEQLISLSPDGRKLAYTTFPGEVHRRGVAVVDLMDGTVRQIPLAFKRGGWVRSLIWSPQGDYLLWRGQPSLARTAAGLIGRAATSSTPLPPERGGSRAYAVDDGGRVAIVERNRIRMWRDGRIVASRPVDPGVPRAAQLVDGDVVEVRTAFRSEDVTGLGQTLMVRQGAGSAESAPLPEDLVNRMTVLGWTSTGAVVVEGDPAMGKTSEPDLYQVELNDARVRSERIVSLESRLPPDRLTVATDLPVADRPVPEWAEEPWWGIDPSLLIGLGVATAIGVLLGLGWLWRRYRAAR